LAQGKPDAKIKRKKYGWSCCICDQTRPYLEVTDRCCIFLSIYFFIHLSLFIYFIYILLPLPV